MLNPFVTMLNPFLGMPVIVDNNLPRFREVQFRFPRSKKRRIRKKWGQDKRNFKTIPWTGGYVVNGTLVISPDTLPVLENRIVKRMDNGRDEEISYPIGGIKRGLI